jgi:hypothetical protein
MALLVEEAVSKYTQLKLLSQWKFAALPGIMVLSFPCW